jgi:hypothetical protein
VENHNTVALLYGGHSVSYYNTSSAFHSSV